MRKCVDVKLDATDEPDLVAENVNGLEQLYLVLDDLDSTAVNVHVNVNFNPEPDPDRFWRRDNASS